MANESDLEADMVPSSDEDDLEAQMQKLCELKNKLPYITNKQAVVEYQAKEIIQKLISDLEKEYDTKFLTDYYNVLKTDDTAAIKEVTNDIILSIQEALRRQRSMGTPFGEWEGVMLAAWLSAATLWSAPRVPDAGRTFHTLLATLGKTETKRIAVMWWRAVPADALLELSAAACAPPAPPALADMLLRAALAALVAHDAPPDAPHDAPHDAPQWAAGALRAEEVRAAAERATRSCPRRTLLRVAARVLATERSAPLIQSLARVARAGAYDGRSERVQVNTSVSKFQTLFGTGGIIPANKKRKKMEDESQATENSVAIKKRRRRRRKR